ncbi:hypothetical protein E1301_Tti021905 [Triplophysa tibetana]|uniref:Uncharacterized protein n=1 Tax=Triplophysa tibetana TaxID=1572043 RepID=A0A5A9NZV7_9TELE|nr:hypothetical protein E1301_Tti021905 [Triplophysa tibetana]
MLQGRLRALSGRLDDGIQREEYVYDSCELQSHANDTSVSRLWPGDSGAAGVIDKDIETCDPVYVFESGDRSDSWDCNFERERRGRGERDRNPGTQDILTLNV